MHVHGACTHAVLLLGGRLRVQKGPCLKQDKYDHEVAAGCEGAAQDLGDARGRDQHEADFAEHGAALRQFRQRVTAAVLPAAPWARTALGLNTREQLIKPEAACKPGALQAAQLQQQEGDLL